MSKKKETGKKKTANKSLFEEPEPWIKELKTLVINDENWRCNVNMVVESNPYNIHYVLAANDILDSSENTRPSIKNISNSLLALELLNMSYSLNNSTASNGYKKLCQEAIKYCSPEGFSHNTPLPILASIIKYYIYSLKLKNLEENRVIQTYLQRKSKAKEDSQIAIQGVVKRASQSNQKSSKKETKGKGSPSKKQGKEKVQELKFTEIRKKGEEILDTIFELNDEPEDGPQLHIILNSFMQAELPSELLKLNVPLTALIKLHNFVIPDQNCLINENDNRKVCNGFNIVASRATIKQRKFYNTMDEHILNATLLDYFWKKFLKILSDKNNVPLFKDTIFIKFYPKLYDSFFLSRKKNPDTVYEKLKKSFYNQLCHLQFDIEDVKRQHANFINHLITRDVEQKEFHDFNKTDIYWTTLETIPPEIINIPFILDCILVQVEQLVDKKQTEMNLESEKDLTVTEHKELKIENSFDSETIKNENHFNMKLQELDLFYDLFDNEENKKFKSLEMNKGSNRSIYLKNTLPTVLVHGDDVGIKTSWWENDKCAIKNITCNMLKIYWDNFLSRHLPLYDASFGFLKNGTDLFTVLKNTGCISVCDKFCNLPCLFDETSFKVEDKASVFCLEDEDSDNNLPISRDNEAIGIKCCDDLSKDLVHYEDPAEGYFVGQMYDHHSYCFEEMTSDVLLQNLFDSLEKFNCVDLQQDCFENKIFLKFHHRPTCCNEEYKLGTLKTKTAIRDFYDYTIDEEFYWLNEEEMSYDKALLKKRFEGLAAALHKIEYVKKRTEYMASKICSETNFIMHNTLKQGDQIEPAKLLKVPSYIEDESVALGNGHYPEEVQYLQSFNIELPNRVQFSEKIQDFIISENSQLRVKYLSKLYNSDALVLKTTIYGHTLYFHQPVGSPINSCFHLIHDSGIVFYFNRNKIGKNMENEKNTTDSILHKNGADIAATEMLIQENTEGSDIFLKPLFYQLSISLPSTLCFQLINSNDIPMYIKQFYLMQVSVPDKLQQEKFRCYLTDGKIIKFMKDETVIIYCPSSEIFNCVIFQQSINSENEPNLTVNTNNLKTKQTKNFNMETPMPDIPLEQNSCVKSYEHTSATGKRILVDNGKTIELESLFVKSYSDIFNGVIITERSDGTKLTYNREGTLFIDFPDGSRITTTASFANEEIVLVEPFSEDFNEIYDNDSEEFVAATYVDSFVDYELNEMNENFFEKYSSNYNFPRKPVGFTVVIIQHLFEHLNYTSVYVDLNREEISINLPCNVDVALSSEGLYKINFDSKAEFITDYDKLIFREINNEKLPEFTIRLENKIADIIDERDTSKNKKSVTINNQDNTVANNAHDKLNSDIQNIKIKNNEGNDNNNYTKNYKFSSNLSKNILSPLLSCKDDCGNNLTIYSNGNIEMNMMKGTDNICKCDTIKKNRAFIFSDNYDGLEVFPTQFLDFCYMEAKNFDNCVTQNYGSVDHNVLLILKPKTKNERERWLMPLKEIKYFPLYFLPSTYNDKDTFFNPFPKRKFNPTHKINPQVLLVRAINRVNCNIHLNKETFLYNKQTADSLRLNKNYDVAAELFERGDIPFCKANKDFIDYIKNIVINSLIARVRRRVVKRLEMRKIKENTNILVNRLLLPYFDSAQGAVFEILLDILLNTIRLTLDDRNKLEKLFCKPLAKLRDEDLDYMHNRIAPLTVTRFCNCDTNKDFCQLKILLLAGRTLHDIFPDMISVFHSFGSNLKKKKAQKKLDCLKDLLLKPSDTLTENDLTIMHDKLKKLTNLCSCNEAIQNCRLRLILMACVTLSFIFPDVNSILEAYQIHLLT